MNTNPRLIDSEAPKSVTTQEPNEFQRQAIEHTEGPLLIIAGPGSGKTYTLVERIVHIILSKSVSPENILVVTFTEKAASELITRVSNRLIELNIRFNLNEMYIGTIHSICLRLLQENREFTRLKRNFIVFDDFDQKYFVYDNLATFDEIEDLTLLLGESVQSAWSKTEALVKWINMISEEALDPESLVNASDPEISVLGRCGVIYQDLLRDNNSLDFSTIQYEALNLLQNNPQVLEALRQKLQYLMVDEYQDTNTIQEKILFLLMNPEAPNLCVVGDDDQGLYRFRGATIRNILEFPSNFPDGQCKQIHLTINYRSHPGIIDFYNQFIQQQEWRQGSNTFRYDKKILPEEKPFPDIPSVVKVSGVNDEDYYHEVLSFLLALQNKQVITDFNQIAFLFRSVKNKKAVALSRYLEENGIPVYSPRSNQFFDREEIRLLIGALIFLFPQFPNIRQERADITLPIWDYYDNHCFALFASELRKPENEDLLRWAAPLARKHLALTENTDYAFAALFYQLVSFPLFSRYLDENLMVGGVNDLRPMRNLATFSQLIGKFEYLNDIRILNPKSLTDSLRLLFNKFFRFLKEGGIDEYEDQQEYAPSGCVSFFTIHQSKGLEFPIVIVDSLYSVPRKQYTHIDELLEANYLSRPTFEPLQMTKFYDFYRLFYTAFSRAQNLLVLSCAEKAGNGRTPSAYFTDLYNSLPSWRDPAFDVSRLELARIKDISLKKEYAFTSHLTVFENCAEQYRFFKELGFSPVRTSPILFGLLVHQTIEDIHSKVLKGEVHLLTEENVSDWFETNYTYLTKRERVYLAPHIKSVALNNVLRYLYRHQGNWDRIRESEVDVSLVKDDYILKGTIDLIRGDGDTVEILDFKSEKKPDVNFSGDSDRLERYHRQLEIYAHLVEERLGVSVSKLHLYYTNEELGSPYISFDKDGESIDTTIKNFDHAIHCIESKDFAIKERPTKQCADCDMRFYCDKKNWKFLK